MTRKNPDDITRAMNPENKNIRRVGILGAATFAVLGGGAMGLSSLNQYRALEVERVAVTTGANPLSQESPRVRQITSGMVDALAYSAIGGVVFVAGSAAALGAAGSIIQSNRRRPGA